MSKYFNFFLFVFLLFSANNQLCSQVRSMRVFYPEDTLKMELIYRDTDSLGNGKLTAYFKENPDQIAYEKNYYYGRQSGIYKSYYPEGKLMILSIYERGMRNGDYAYYGLDGKVLIKAKYRDGIRHGYFVDHRKKVQGKFRNGKRDGKWEFNVKTPAYRKVYYADGVEVGKPTLLERAKGTVSDLIPSNSSGQTSPSSSTSTVDSSATNSKRLDLFYDQYDTLYLKSKESDSLQAYPIYYLPYDSLLHPTLRKAIFVDKPEQTAVVKYYRDGKQNGIFQYFYPNGNLYQYGYFEFGIRVDDWKQYDPFGNLRIRGRYRDDKKHGKWMYNIGTPEYRTEKWKEGERK